MNAGQAAAMGYVGEDLHGANSDPTGVRALATCVHLAPTV